jgi:uncharacterized Ntn-hydrolase superfamily protein
VGAISTQSWINPYLGIDGLRLLAEGLDANQSLHRLMTEDPGREMRQLGLVDSKGSAAAWSGSECTDWFGHVTGPNFAVQGNMLLGERTIQVMAEVFQRAEPLSLPERLIAALEAGQAAGGDKRGRQSAALLVHHKEEYPYLSLRVDEHPFPIAELRRIFEIARYQLLPFVDSMPTRANPLGDVSKTVIDVLMTPPPFRPGGGGSSR